MEYYIQQLCTFYKVKCTISKSDNLNIFIHNAVLLIEEIDNSSLSTIECNENVKFASLLSLKLSFLATFSNLEQIAYIQGIDNSLKSKERENDIYISANYFNGLVSNETTCNVIIKKLKDNGIVLHINDILHIIPFSHRTEMILSFGGDDRLVLLMNKNKVNKYGSSTIPYENVLRRGSCTCSTIITKVYLECDQYRVMLLQKSLILDPLYVENMIYNEQDSIRNRLKKVFNMYTQANAGTSKGEIVLFPSGSDAEFLPSIAAIERSMKLISSTNSIGTKVPKVYNYVTAAGEVGSGTSNAAGLKHFSAISPRRDGKVLEVNKLLDGIGENIVEVIQYKPRGNDGSINLLEDEIIVDIRNRLNNNDISVAILHVVVGTKTGIVYPSLDTVSIVEKEFGDRVIIVIDACQLRIKLDTEYLDKNYIVLFTGSKYFSGPPFSGGVAMSNKVVASIENYMKLCNHNDPLVINSTPKGLADYLTAYEIPSSMIEFRKFLGVHPQWNNIGLLFRFHCALPILEAYSYLKPSDILSFTQSWVTHLIDLINNDFSSSIKLVEANNSKTNIMYGNLNTVISFSVFVDDENNLGSKRFLTFDELKLFHQKIGIPFLIDKDENSNSGNNIITSRRIMLGQPVKLSEKTSYTVIRIALGANMVVDALSSSTFVEIGLAVNKIFQADLIILKKIDLLAKNWRKVNESESALSPLLNRMMKFDRELSISTPSSCTSISTSIDIISKVLSDVKEIPIVAMYYNIDSYISTINLLKQAFNKPKTTSTFIHCFAIKSCPLSYICHVAVSNGLGLECASLQEVIQALRCGCPANTIMFDSPCKCIDDIRFALLNGVHMNANTIAEVERIKNVIEDLQQEGKIITGTSGMRINPLVGAGSNSALSTATSTSKFGVPLVSNGGSDDNEDEIIQIFVNNPFLIGVMCHVGSQGMPIELMVDGVNCILNLADKIDLACGYNRVTNLDIGGGLSANYLSDEITPTFEDYSTSIFNSCPKLFTCGRVVYTEMGKSLIAKSGVIVTKIEDTIKEIGDKNGHLTAVAHAGADILLRTAYCPNKFAHRINLLNSTGEVLKTSNNSDEKSNIIRNSITTTIAGPLCFSGDVLATRIMLPEAQAGDYCCILDAGANTISIFRLSIFINYFKYYYFINLIYIYIYYL